jgi:hypothetical protein
LFGFRAGRLDQARGVSELYFVAGVGRDSPELMTPSILGPDLRPVRRQDTPPERRVPYVQAISFDDHPAILDTHEHPARLDGIAEQLDA